MKAYDILLVEDTPEILLRNRAALIAEGYSVAAAYSLREARELLDRSAFDLLILDIMLPDGSGLDLCQELRERTNAPILFLTVLCDSDQIVGGLRAGGDDYITKPYQMQELIARVAAQLRRSERLAGSQTGKLGPLRLDGVSGRAYLDGRDLLLSPKEYQILTLLMQRPGEHRPSGEIFAEVWGLDTNKDVRTVRVHISHLRAKLRDEWTNVRIEHTDPGGYRIALGGGDAP